jgi:RES domain-containing protein
MLISLSDSEAKGFLRWSRKHRRISTTAANANLAHGSGRLPPNQHYIAITIPSELSCEMPNPAYLPGLDDAAASASKPTARDGSKRSDRRS